MMPDLLVHGLYVAYVLAFLLGFATIFTWVERKQSAVMSDRIGANRAYVRIPFTQVKLVWWGLFHGMADGLKMIFKENFTPATYDRFCYNLAPWLAAVPVLLVFAVVPFGGEVTPGRFFEPGSAGAEFFGDRTWAHADLLGRRRHSVRAREFRAVGLLGTNARGLVVQQQVLRWLGAARPGLPDDFVQCSKWAPADSNGRNVRHGHSFEWCRAHKAAGPLVTRLVLWSDGVSRKKAPLTAD